MEAAPRLRPPTAPLNSAASSSSSWSSSGGFVTIDDLKDLEVVAGFAEADATKIAVGQPATVTLVGSAFH